MAVTISNLKRVNLSNLKGTIADVTFDSSYPTGGEALTPAQLGLSVVDYLGAESAAGYNFAYDRANKKLIAYTAGAQVTDKTDLSTVVARIFVVGW